MPDKLTDKEIVKASGAGGNVSSLLDTINGLTLERSNLIAEVNRLQAENELLNMTLNVTGQIKAEAYKEFAERVKAKYCNGYTYLEIKNWQVRINEQMHRVNMRFMWETHNK